MILDFKEIPAGNKKGPQGQFELFAREFLQLLDYVIVNQPGPGPDGGEDLIVEKAFWLDAGLHSVRFLVSCKHNANRSGVGSVRDKDEINVWDRVNGHKCQGFLAIYSTSASKALSQRLEKLKPDIQIQVFDDVKIEKCLRELPLQKSIDLISMFFPKAQTAWIKEGSLKDEIESRKKSLIENPGGASFELMVEANMTAIILLEIDKIEFEYMNTDWEKAERGLSKLSRFSQRNNATIARRVFSLLYHFSVLTRAGMPKNVAQGIFSLVMDFFIVGVGEEMLELRNELGEMGTEIAFGIVYDATLYHNDLAVAKWGLSLLKFFYMKRNRSSTPEIRQHVLRQYQELEETLKRKDWSDLSRAQRLVQAFKADLKVNDLSWPRLDDDLAL